MSRFTFKLPDIGEGVVEGEIVAWHIKPGDTIAEDAPLVDVMTDKATVTIPSVVDGKVLETNGSVGELVAVGSELVVIETSGDAPVQTEEQTEQAEPVSAGAIASTSSTVATTEVKSTTSGNSTSTVHRAVDEKPIASPAVRRRARERGIDLFHVTGSGRGGRILDADLESFLTASSHSGPSRQKRTGIVEVPVVGLRRRIAEKMAQSKRTIAHFSYFEEVDITELEALRQHLNSTEYPGEHEIKLTYIPFVMLALAKAVHQFPQCNAHYDDESQTVIRHQPLHLGIATQTERGLYVPVVRHVEALDVWQAASEVIRLAQAARDNTATSEELSGSTFTLTSLGKMGGLGATPIINHPEVGILGLHKAEERAVVCDGQIVIRRMMNLSSSFDHRVVDGADGAALVQSVKRMLENPATIFV
ncbi:MAG: 2-oxo acid dehydrogenase subunit E2 [Pirellulales bacterium]|nr:2-oxo acid dehydrogenase subunit E2 [Pirellulales bacterium]